MLTFYFIVLPYRQSYFQEVQNQWFCKFYCSYQLQPNLASWRLWRGQSEYWNPTRPYNLHWRTLFNSCSYYLSFTSKVRFLNCFQWTILLRFSWLYLYSIFTTMLHPLPGFYQSLISLNLFSYFDSLFSNLQFEAKLNIIHSFFSLS